jgi:hypothetical protein
MKHHYTVRGHLDKIVAERVIRQATEGLQPGERPVVWFSTNPLWERTVCKVDRANGDPLGVSLQQHWEMSQRPFEAFVGDGMLGAKLGTIDPQPQFQPARITVADEVASYTWEDFKRLSGISKKSARALYQAAIRVGARPGEWFVSFEPVPAEKWLAVELYNGAGWEPLAGA